MARHVDDMFSGKEINISEQRSVLHTALRNTSKKPIVSGGKNVMPEVEETWHRIQSLCEQWVGVTDVIHIGIGGSVFGPQLVVEALANLPTSTSSGMRIHFAANIDSEELVRIFKIAIPASTRVIIVSKTFNTSETLMNANAVINWLKLNGCSDSHIKSSLIAVTENTFDAKLFGIVVENIFPLWSWVGGRFSVWSSVGICIALQYGFDTFMSLLKGAECMDEHFQNTPIEKNVPILMALALLHQQVEHSCGAYAVIPYANCLELFPFWLQQLEMESHGKTVGRDGQLIYRASPVVFGSVGSNAQHSYFQLLHQGNQIIPVDFIVVAEPMSDLPEAADHHQVLLANCLAQAQALSLGKASKITNEVHTGRRPSNLLILPKLDAFNLGALMALYESRTVALGILWGINSFDQPGVELGKQLARPINLALMKGGQIDGELIDPITTNRVNYFKSRAVSPTV
jgi:glucose-6-phosphate isomerase